MLYECLYYLDTKNYDLRGHLRSLSLSLFSFFVHFLIRNPVSVSHAKILEKSFIKGCTENANLKK